jgi:hypothetical protein
MILRFKKILAIRPKCPHRRHLSVRDDRDVVRQQDTCEGGIVGGDDRDRRNGVLALGKLLCGETFDKK